MTNTQELQNLAKDPQAFDTELARLHDALAQAQDMWSKAVARIHRMAGDRQRYQDRAKVWGKSLAECIEILKSLPVGMDDLDVAEGTTINRALADRTGLLRTIASLSGQINEMDEVYDAHRWTRFYPSVTKSQPHIHRSLSCHTLHATTVMSWAPELSGKTDEEAVSELDEALCSVCFPSAPVALHEYVSRKSQAEREQREMAKAERDAKKAAKMLDPQTEAFKTTGRFPERITTVAACKELIRKAVELAVELDWYTSPQADKQLTDWSPDQRAQRERNGRVSLDEARKDAAEALRC